MRERLNSHGVDVSRIKKGDLVAVRVTGVDQKDENLPVEMEYKIGCRVWAAPEAIFRHIPADEPMPAPQPARLGDKPARGMTVREEFVKAAMHGWLANPTGRGTLGEVIETADRMIAALEGSSDK